MRPLGDWNILLAKCKQNAPIVRTTIDFTKSNLSEAKN